MKISEGFRHRAYIMKKSDMATHYTILRIIFPLDDDTFEYKTTELYFAMKDITKLCIAITVYTMMQVDIQQDG